MFRLVINYLKKAKPQIRKLSTTDDRSAWETLKRTVRRKGVKEAYVERRNNGGWTPWFHLLAP